MVDMTVVGTEGRLLTAVGGGEEMGGEEYLGCKFSVLQSYPKENLKLTTAKNHGKTELLNHSTNLEAGLTCRHIH